MVHQVRALVQHGLDQAVIVRALALDHVAGQRPGAAGKANQRHAAVQRAADRGHGVKHVAQALQVRHGQRVHGGLVTHRRREARALALRERQAQAHGVGHGQDVAEQDGRVQRVTLQRLQGDFGGVVDLGCQAHETAGLGARGAVFGQVAAGLAHQPDGRVVGGLAQAGAQKAVVLKGGVGRWHAHPAIVAGQRKPGGR